jgi:hypothetical protein
MKHVHLVLLTGVVFIMFGCNASDLASLHQYEGHYEGLIFGKNLDVEGLGIGADVALGGTTDLTVTAQGESQKWNGTFDIHIQSQKTITIDTSTGEFQKTQLSLENKTTCFKSSDTDAQPVVLQLCLDSGQISLTVDDKQGVTQFKLQLSSLQPGVLPPMEKPASYTLSQLVTRAKARNFQTVIEFQKVLQARDESVNAYENLLPHIGISDVLNVASLNALNIVKTIGDLAPFLLPDRWIRAKQDKEQYQGETDSWRAMDADGMSVTEGLTLSALQQAKAIACLQNERDSVAQVREEVLDREHSGGVPVGSSDDITAIVDEIDSDILLLNETNAEALASLSEAAGFYNPQAVTSVSFGPQQSALGYTVDKPIKVDITTWNQLAIARSPELGQLNDFLTIAKQQKKSMYFTWLDPSGDPNAGVGFGLPSYIAIGQDQVNEIKAQQSLMTSGLLQKVSDVATTIGQSLQSYSLAQTDVDVQTRRVKRIENSFNLGTPFEMSDLVDALEGQEKANLDVIDWEYSYYVNLSRLNRIIYSGQYADIPFQNPTQ